MDRNYTIRKRLVDIIITVFIVLLISSLFFGDKDNKVKNVTSEISNFEENVLEGNVITDGVISDDTSFERIENKISKVNGDVGETIYKVINGGKEIVVKILKQIVD